MNENISLKLSYKKHSCLGLLSRECIITYSKKKNLYKSWHMVAMLSLLLGGVARR